MRITIDLDRVGHRPRIRTWWYSGSRDDPPLLNLGLAMYEEWEKLTKSIDAKMGGRQVVIDNMGERK